MIKQEKYWWTPCNGTRWKGNLGKLNVPLGCDLYKVHRSVGQFHLNEQFSIIEDRSSIRCLN